MFIDETIAANLIRHTRELLKLVATLPENDMPERQGVYLCVRDQATGVILLLVPVGKFDDMSFARRCCLYAQEKTARLLSHPHHLASSQSANPDLELYGGGVVCPVANVIIAPSGLTAVCDEALGANLGLKMGWMFPDQISHLSTLTQNTAITSLCRAA